METDSAFADFSKLRLKKVNRTHSLVGDVTYFQELNNDLKLKVLLFKKQGGQYRLTQFKTPVQGICDFYNSDKFVVEELQKSCDKCPRQADKQCPWKAVSLFIIITDYN